jgi:superfamily II DNA/RNA helicase
MHTAQSRGLRRRNPRGRRFGNSKPTATHRSSGTQSRPRTASRGGGRPNARRKIATFDPTQFINRNPTEYTEEVYTPRHTFGDFAIDNRIKQTLAAMNHTVPSPIQDQVIPEILAGRDVVGLAQTGTGKTAAFLIPLIELKKQDTKSVTLILAPTRELAIQVDAELARLAKNFRFFSTVCVGGTGIGAQIRQLRRQNQFIIGTPGRIKDLLARGVIDPSRITSVVLDEADRMLDMGFIHDMRSILGELPKRRHTLFFSATMDEKTKLLVHEFMHDPVTISVKKKDVTDSIAQDVVHYTHANKYQTLLDLLRTDEFRRVIVFGAMKHSVEKLGKALNQSGITAESIHGNKNHSQRQRSLTRFKSGNAQVLVATDVAARGIHVDNVTHVINYDLPGTFEDYVHRIGRTGRGAKRGQALTFVGV